MPGRVGVILQIFSRILYSRNVIRLRLHPAGPRTDRIALEDDVLPLSQPLTTVDGDIVSSIAIKAGQVCLPYLSNLIDSFE